MRLGTALRLGRVANLPAVASGVLAAVVLAGTAPRGTAFALACVALGAMYLAGCWLDDAFDRDDDRVHRPDRPIPAGEAPAGIVFDVGFVLLAAGVALIAVAALVTGAGGRPILAAVALASLIIFHAASGPDHALGPALLGLCRGGVYVTTALLVARQLRPELLLGAGLVVAYVAGIRAAARQQNLEELATMWPLALLALPFAMLRPDDTVALAIYAGFLIWVVRGLSLIRRGERRSAVAALTAGTSLLDALMLASLGRIELAAAALAAFFLALLLQRVVPD